MSKHNRPFTTEERSVTSSVFWHFYAFLLKASYFLTGSVNDLDIYCSLKTFMFCRKLSFFFLLDFIETCTNWIWLCYTFYGNIQINVIYTFTWDGCMASYTHVDRSSEFYWNMPTIQCVLGQPVYCWGRQGLFNTELNPLKPLFSQEISSD